MPKSVFNLAQQGGLHWMPDADSVNAPEGVLLRADNLVPDREGALTVRRGSTELNSSLGTSVHTLYTSEIDSTRYRVIGVDDKLLINGDTKDAAVGGTSGADIAVGDDSYQQFFARGSWKKKWDGTTFNNWSQY
jgi:hypothetical protein